jgi:hypothetical protein
MSVVCIIDTLELHELGKFDFRGGMNSVLRLLFSYVFLRIKNLYLRWCMRRHGIDSDSIPEIRELRRRRRNQRRFNE